MTGPWVFLLGSPIKLGLWIGNRVATWSGLLYLWRRMATRPQGWRAFLVWAAWINLLSLTAMAGLFYWLFVRSHS